MITRGELRRNILLGLMKTPKYPGIYGEEKVNAAIQEAIDFVAMEMFEADEGWLTSIQNFTTEANQNSIDIPSHVAMIKEVRYLSGDTYVPLDYDAGVESSQSKDAGGAARGGSSYRIVDNAIYFNPALAEGGADYLQIEYMFFPKRLQSDEDFTENQFNQCMQHFIKYRSMTILAVGIEKMVVTWQGIEASWFKKMNLMLNKRNLQSQRIREFDG